MQKIIISWNDNYIKSEIFLNFIKINKTYSFNFEDFITKSFWNKDLVARVYF